MNAKKVSIVSGYILEEESSLTLAELCWTCHTPAETIIRMVDHGVITPVEGNNTRQWLFPRSALIRADKALRLKHDLGINLAGTALALELLDEINTLRQQLRNIDNKLA